VQVEDRKSPASSLEGRRRARLVGATRKAGADEGSVLVLVLVLSFVVASALTVALTTSSASLDQTRAYTDTTSARLAAESGIQATLVAIESARSSAALPSCTPTTTDLGTASYTTTVQYFQGSTPLCPLTSQPPTMTATITSTGTAGTNSVEMQADVTITATLQPMPAFDYALFSASYVTMDSGATLLAGTGSAAPTVYAGTTFSCTNTNLIEGNVEVYAPGSSGVSLTSSCAIDGTLYVEGPVSLTNNVTLGGLEEFGGSLSMTSTPTIKGSAYVSGGGITIGNTGPTIEGNVGVTGSIVSKTGSIPPGTFAGSVCSGSTSCVPSSISMPPPQSFPVLDPTSWPSSYTVDTVSGSACNGFGSYQYPGGGPAPSPFADDVANAPQGGTTVIDASQCASGVTLEGASTKGNGSCPTSGPSYYTLHSNIILMVSSLSDYGCNTFVSGSGGPYDLVIMVPDPIPGSASGELYFTNTTHFASNLNVLLYTPGEAYFDCTDDLTGQIVAGQVYTTNSFSLTASNAASQIVPSALAPSANHVTIDDEVLLRA
jgi:hypothetical protein